MVENLDGALRRLAAAPVHPGLDGIEDSVLERLRERPRPLPTIGTAAFAALAALLLGVAAEGPMARSVAPDPLSPFAPSSPLAPSTLLGAGE